MKILIVGILVLGLTVLNGQTSLLFTGNPITFSDKNEIPIIGELIEEFKRDSSLNGKKLLADEFLPYLEMIQESTVLLKEFKLVSQETEIDFLAEYNGSFVKIDKSPLYCSCHRKRFSQNQKGQLIEDEKGDTYSVLVFGVGKEFFSDLSFGIILKENEFTSYFIHFDRMNYKTLKSDFEKRELTIINSKSADLVLENSENEFLIGRFKVKSKELQTDEITNSYFQISGEFSCKLD
jgi:hypothetical protein